MRYATNCKFCKKPITLEVDDDYHKMGDPHNLIPGAACNSCADVRELRRRLTDKINSMSAFFQRLYRSMNETDKLAARERLEKILKKYANVIARLHGKDGMAWDDAFVEEFLKHPELCNEIVSRMWKVYRLSERT